MNNELREDLEHLIICNDKTITPDLRDDVSLTLQYIDKLEKENKILKENAIHNDKVVDKVNWENRLLKDRLSKAIEYINELIADTKGMLDDMKYQDKEETITRFVEDLEKDIKNYEHLEDILRGEDNDNT
jgi:hypothetical protein